jgi:pilus assembly protein Flp/PilA
MFAHPSGGFALSHIHRMLRDRTNCACFRDRKFTFASLVRAHRPPMIALVRKFCADETGATAIEYGLIAAGISLAIIAVVNGIGSHLNTKFTSINTTLK